MTMLLKILFCYNLIDDICISHKLKNKGEHFFRFGKSPLQNMPDNPAF